MSGNARPIRNSMKSLVLDSPGHLVWKEVPEPVASAGQAVVRVLRCGVCGTDIHALSGKQPFFSYPRVLGHELCVEVVEAAAGGPPAGTLCALEPYYFFGSCPPCLAGRTNCCHQLQVLGVHLDGGHVPLLAVPNDKLHPAPGLMPDQIALIEPLAIGAHAVERAALQPGERVAILGMGPIGLAVALAARARNADVALVDLDEKRLSFAADCMELGEPFKGGEDLESRLRAHFGGYPRCVIDATGSRHSMNRCFEFTEHGGRVVFVGLFIGNLEIDDPNFHRRELTLLASRAALPATFDALISQISSGVFDPTPLVTHRLHFDTLDRELPDLHLQPGLVKAIIDF